MRRAWLLVLAAAVLGGLARLGCLGGEFWLDEIWSFELAHDAASPGAILFATRHDNNHHLNTLWLSPWPAGLWWGWYRLHAVAAGLASIVLAARVARRKGAVEAVLAALLVACCSWLVLAGAEARGYALAVCFALLALDALWSYLDTRSHGALGLFWLAALLGFLSHLTFVHAYLGFVVWSLRRFARERRSPGDEVRRLLLVHGVPAAFFAVFYLGSIRGMEVGGGPPAGTLEVLARLVGLGLGGPAGGWESLPFAVAAVGLLAGGLIRLRREGDDVWAFFAVTVVASPALFLLFRRQEFLFERYLFVPFTFFLLLSALPLATLLRRGGAARLAALALLAVFLVGNAWTVGNFVAAGRGQFHEALAWVVEHDSSDVVRVTGDHDFRVAEYVRFYTSYLPSGRNVRYLGKEEVEAEGGADWLLEHRNDLDRRPPPGERERDAAGYEYRLVKSYPSRGFGAWGWFIYRRVPQRDVGQQKGRRHPDEAQVFHARQQQRQGEPIDGQVRRQGRRGLPLATERGGDLYDRNEQQDQVEGPAAVGRRQHADQQQQRQALGPVPGAPVPPPVDRQPHDPGHQREELPAERRPTQHQPDDRAQGGRAVLCRRPGGEGVPVVPQHIGVEGQGDRGQDQPGQGAAGQDAPAPLVERPEQQGEPEQVGKMGLDAQQRQCRPRGQVAFLPHQDQEADGAEQQQRRDLPGDDGEVGGQEGDGRQQRQQAARGRPAVDSPQRQGTAGDDGEVEQQPEQVGRSHRQQGQGQDEGQGPGRVPHEDALVVASGLPLQLVDQVGIIRVVAGQEQPAGGPVFDEVVQRQRRQRPAEPALQDQHGQGGGEGQAGGGETEGGEARHGELRNEDVSLASGA